MDLDNENAKPAFTITINKLILYSACFVGLVVCSVIGSFLVTTKLLAGQPYTDQQVENFEFKNCFDLICLNNNHSSVRCVLSSEPNETVKVKRSVSENSSEVIDYRLPPNLRPFFYEIQLKPFIGPPEIYANKSFTTEGSTKIHFKCAIPTNQIYFHAKDLDIDSLNLELTSSHALAINTLEYDLTRDFAILNLNGKCHENETYILTVNFIGLISHMFGFYRSSYNDTNGNTYHLAITQFEPSEARRVFPCFDEPGLKASFQLVMVRHKNFTSSLFNTPLINSTIHPDEPEWIVDTFEKTVQMSTYLVGFVVSNLKTISGVSPKYKIQTDIVARPEAIDNGEGLAALEETTKIIDFFADYFNVSYPLKKISHIAVPDFFAGAMENWGIVVYRENYLLFNPNIDSFMKKKRIFEVIYHEIAHQWFGNIVSPAWWNDLWLNEGFASWFESVGKNFTHPEWNDNDNFFVEKISTLVLDSLESTHSVSFEVNNAEEVKTLFDEISYNKGSSIIRMMYAFLTEDTTKKGLNKYLKKYAYKNANQDNLWEELSNQAHLDKTLDSDLNVKQIMDTWTLQKGYPIVHVNRTSNALNVTQKWFLLDPLNDIQNSLNQSEYNSYKWYVPFTYTTKSALNFQFETRPTWLKPNQKELIIELRDSNDWILANLKHAGFYRVNYDLKNWQLLIEQLSTDHTVIDTVSRAQLIDDSFNLGRAELIDQTIYLEIIDYMQREANYLPIEAAYYGLDFISKMISKTPEFEDFKIFYKKTFEKILYKFQEDLSSENTEINLDLQHKVIASLCKYGHKKCIRFAENFYSAWVHKNETLPKSFDSVILVTVIENGNYKVWKTIYDRVLTAASYQQRLLLFTALTHSKNTTLLKFILEKSDDDSLIKKQDQTTIIKSVASNPYGQKLAIEYLDTNWDRMMHNFGSLVFVLSDLIKTVYGNLNTQSELNQLEDFLIRHPDLGSASLDFRKTIEIVKTNVRWMNKNFNTISDWLKVKTKESKMVTKYRLPSQLRPIAYDIFLQPYFTSTKAPESFLGKIRIDFNCSEDTNRLVLHMKDLVLNGSTLMVSSITDTNYMTLRNFTYCYDDDAEVFLADFVQVFRRNHVYSFYVDFMGSLTNDNKGLYRSSYFDGETLKWLLVTQFECIEGRKAFISFDEPGFKAKFKITIKHDASLKAFSNMPIKSQIGPSDDTADNWIITEFEETPIMPLYSVGLVIADFICESTLVPSVLSNNTVNISICSRPNAVHKVQVLYEYSLNILNYYEQYFNLTYPLTKIDHITVPDFNFGAMENWGIVIYKEELIFYDENETDEIHYEMIARVLYHEIAHMWFGNLVTHKWWDDLWLNEGFARYYDFMTTSYLFPDWNLRDSYKSSLMSIMQVDSGNYLNPITYDVNSPKEINTVINPYTTYGKGAATIGLLNYILGEKNMVRALGSYLKKYQYQAVDQNDFWNVLQQESGFGKAFELEKKMSSWTRQSGHPLITVKKINSTHILVEQKPFIKNPIASDISDWDDSKYLSQVWYVPFTYTIETSNSTKTSFTNIVDMDNLSEKIIWILANETKKIIQLDGYLLNENFILANIDFAAFYRVNYDAQNWLKIIDQLNHNKQKISKTMKAQLINDAFALARSGDVNPTLPLQLTKFLAQESEYLPWKVFLDKNNVFYYTKMLVESPLNGPVKDYLAKLVEPVYSKLGWKARDDDKWLHKKLRKSVVSFACQQDVPSCVETSLKYFKDWMDNEKMSMKILPGLKPIAFCTAIRHGDSKMHNFLEEKLQNTSFIDQVSKLDMLKGLVCSKDHWRVNNYLYTKFDHNAKLLKETAVDINSNGNFLIWSFLKNQWNKLLNANDEKSLVELVHEIVISFNTQDQYADYIRFFEENKSNFQNEESLKLLHYSANEIISNIRWSDNMSKQMKNFDLPKFSPQEGETAPGSYRLPTNVRPNLYELQLCPYIGTHDQYGNRSFTFDGSVHVHFTCLQATRKIVIHSQNLKFIEVGFKHSARIGFEMLELDSIEVDTERQFISLPLEESCVANENYTLKFVYIGQINEKFYGFYQSSYFDANYTKFYLATTHFQPGEARHAFPCFDEPSMKAQFELKMVRHMNFTSSFHNSPIISSVTHPDRPEWIIDTFERTVPMSTYLVGFVVSNFEKIRVHSPKYNIEIEVSARPDAIRNGDADYALSETAVIIDYFADYFNVSYPLQKSTQIAVPDFEAGAMENWGIIIYRETSLLDPSNDATQKHQITQIISHELAHQWFGNLVTLSWWNDLWLNEGFASWVEYIGMNRSHPEWRSLDYFKVHTSMCMNVDSMLSSHPISVQVYDPSEITSLFDLISYFKGSNIIRMMNAFLTEKTFKEGVEDYLNRYQYKNANQDNLWTELTRHGVLDKRLDSNITIKNIMDTWTLQKGYPVVYVNRTDKNELVVTQSWFLLNPMNKRHMDTEEYESYKWYIPFTFTTAKELNFNFETKPIWMKPNQSELKIGLPEDVTIETWVLGNLKQAGYYRVNYDQHNWQLLTQQLLEDHTVIDSLSRAQLIEDSFNLGRAELIDQGIFFRIINYLANEEDPLPFQAAFNGLNFLNDMLSSNYMAYEIFKVFFMRLMEPSYLKYGWREDIDDLNIKNLQLKALEVMCFFGLKDCIDHSQEVFEEWVSNNSTDNAYDNDYTRIFICTAIKFNSDDMRLITLHLSKSSLIGYISCSKNLNLLKLVMKLSAETWVTNSQSHGWIVKSVSKNPIGIRLAYDHLEENWDLIYQKYGGKSLNLVSLIEELTKRLNTEYELERVKTFIKQHSEISGVIKNGFDRSIEHIEANIRWMEANYNGLLVNLVMNGYAETIFDPDYL